MSDEEEEEPWDDPRFKERAAVRARTPSGRLVRVLLTLSKSLTRLAYRVNFGAAVDFHLYEEE